MMRFLFALRGFLGAFIFAIVTFSFSIFAIIVNSRKIQNAVIQSWGKIALKLFCIDLEVKGLENIPKGSGLFLFNHSSFFDVFAMAAAFDDFRFGAKIELFKIPLFGMAMSRVGVLPIARNRREDVFKVYEQAQARAARGEKFALAPEGGRNYDDRLLPFKAGPFIFAINAGMPLVPTLIQGAHSIMKKGSLIPNSDQFRRKIRVTFLPVISVEGVSLERRQELQDRAFREMNEYLNQNPISR